MRSKKKQNHQDYSAGSKKVSLLTWILPWLVLLPGFPAIHFYFKSGILFNTPGAEEAYLRVKNLFSLFYHTAIYGGAVFAALEVIMAFCYFLTYLKLCFGKDFASAKPYGKASLKCTFFAFGTLLLMFFVHAFTYGMSV